MPSVTLNGVAASSGIGSVVQSTSPSAGDFQYYVPGRGYLNDATPTDFAVANWGYADGSASYVVVQVSPTPSGVAATAAVGTIACQITVSTLTGVAAASQIGTAIGEVDNSITGVAATSATGTPTFHIDTNPALTGVAATSAVGTITSQITVSTLTGVASTAQVGTAIGEVDHAITGVAATSATGTPTPHIDTNPALTGVAATSATGNPTFHINTNPALTGVAATGAVTAPTIELDKSIGLTGVQASSAVGTLIPAVPLIGVASASHIGVLAFDHPLTIAGVGINAGVGQLLSISGSNVTNIRVNGVATSATVGTLTPNDRIAVAGVSGNAVVGTPTVAIYRSGLQLIDIECTAAISLVDDFSITLRWSDTDGYSWSDSAIRSIGTNGQYLTNPQWRRLGLSRRGRVFQVSWSCPQATALNGATIMFEDAST